MSIIWLTKLILSHLMTDFLFQKKSWIDDRKTNHFLSKYLYIHTFLTGVLALLLLGWNYWIVAIIIFVTHTLIDGWKSYQQEKAVFFLLDQALHLIVIFVCWGMTFYDRSEIIGYIRGLNSDTNFWIVATAIVFLTHPSAILIGELTRKWRQGLPNAETLANAGRWIGIIERMLMFILVLYNQYEAVGLLVAAKTFIRFADNDRTEQKTEYLLIGTLISIGLSMFVGMLVSALMT